jgi:hypothetical protein
MSAAPVAPRQVLRMSLTTVRTGSAYLATSRNDETPLALAVLVTARPVADLIPRTMH